MKDEPTTSPNAFVIIGVFVLSMLVVGAIGYGLGAARTARIKDDHSVELTLIFTAKLKAQDEQIAQLQQELKDKPRDLKRYGIEAIKQLAQLADDRDQFINEQQKYLFNKELREKNASAAMDRYQRDDKDQSLKAVLGMRNFESTAGVELEKLGVKFPSNVPFMFERRQ